MGEASSLRLSRLVNSNREMASWRSVGRHLNETGWSRIMGPLKRVNELRWPAFPKHLEQNNVFCTLWHEGQECKEKVVFKWNIPLFMLLFFHRACWTWDNVLAMQEAHKYQHWVSSPVMAYGWDMLLPQPLEAIYSSSHGKTLLHFSTFSLFFIHASCLK